MQEKIFDLIIVGAGPCGLACGIEAQKADLDYLIVEKGSIAESIRRYPIHMRFFSTAENIEIGNLPLAVSGAKATRTEALQYYRRVSESYNLNIQLFTTVQNINKNQDSIFEIQTDKQDIIKTKNIALATGYFDVPRELGIKGEYLPHVFKYYDEPFRYIHTKVTIVGGGNSAVETALDLYRHGVEVTIIIRKEDFKPTAKYWLIPDLKRRIKEGKIKVHYQTEVQEIRENKVLVHSKNNPGLKRIDCDFIFLMIGYTPDIQLLRQSGVEINPQDLTATYNPKTFESNVKGLYLVGTVVCGIHTEKVFIENGRYDGKLIVENILSKTNLKS